MKEQDVYKRLDHGTATFRSQKEYNRWNKLDYILSGSTADLMSFLIIR